MKTLIIFMEGDIVLSLQNEKFTIILAGIIIGIIASLLVFFGNPANMGFCIACFLRDTAGGLGLHSAAPVQYIRPEIIGLILGSFIVALGKNEFNAKGGSSPLTRFILGFFVMIGCLMFLGCPFRMILRIAGGDLNALFGLVGFIVGISAGVFFLNRGYTLKRTYKLPRLEGFVLPVIEVALLVLLIAAPAFIHFSTADNAPGAKHAAIAISLGAGLIVGILAQRTRLCMVGGIRDMILFRENKLLLGFIAILISAFVCNLILTSVTAGTYFNFGFAGQPIAHTDGLWNFLGMFLAGFGCVLLGGCPLRQLVLSGEGNTDSAITVIGLIIGAAFAHNFGLASSGDGPTLNGKIAVIIGIIVITVIAFVNTMQAKKQ
ncbi:MAG TPA: YedE-related selenium metabolism membrane protein [Megamonas hypermegale]|uniref:YedE family putative selenium transporter n=1 Tax=Megamonas hypermegale TaxID=158847 RepID=UPI001D8B0F9F|nr:YedE family putative selenium transporter [Megamonas hypermegale]HJG08152.1 YedE-related selenium metabolism membrane protein [Megamonas hypermegale]